MAASRYELIAKLASGGMGSVFVGRVRGPLGFSRLVAIKRAHPHLVDDPTFVQMLVDEAKLASLIHHPHVVSVLDVERVKEQTPRGPKREIRLVMDYVEGLTLAEVATLAEKQGIAVAPGIAVRALLDAGAGLQAAHELCDDAGTPLGIVHRDISPQNLIVGVDGMTRVSDFGIAKATMRPGATTSGALKGKLGYMAPEYVTQSALDARSDVFALGVVLWEALAGRKLFRGGNEVATLELVARCEVPRISEVRPDVGTALDDVLESALARDPDHRFGAARALVNALETAARRGGLCASHEDVAALVRKLGKEGFEKRRSDIRDRVRELDAKALTGSTTEQQLRGSVERARDLIAAEGSSVAPGPSTEAATPHIASPLAATQAEDATFGSGVVTPPDHFVRGARARSRGWVWGLALVAGLAIGAVVVFVGFTPPKSRQKAANASPPSATAAAVGSGVAAPTITLGASATPASAKSSTTAALTGARSQALPQLQPKPNTLQRPPPPQTNDIPPNPYQK